VGLPGLGKVRLVVSFKSAEVTGTYAVLVSNQVDWNAQRLITLYLQRWLRGAFYQDVKTYEELAHQNHWGSVSSASAGVVEALILYAHKCL
jgi:hypothetical protein